MKADQQTSQGSGEQCITRKHRNIVSKLLQSRGSSEGVYANSVSFTIPSATLRLGSSPMHHPTDDLRIRQIRPLIPPAILQEEIAASDEVADLVNSTRKQVGDILHGRDKRVVAIVGPCSIHDPAAALE